MNRKFSNPPPEPDALKKRRVRPTDPMYPGETDTPEPLQASGDYDATRLRGYNESLRLAGCMLEYLPRWSMLGADGVEGFDRGVTHPILITPEGYRVSLQVDRWRKAGRVVLSLGCLRWEDRLGNQKYVGAYYLRRGNDRIDGEEATLAATRTHKDLARALLTRYYPFVRDNFPRLVAVAQKWESDHWEQVDALETVARAIGVKPHGSHSQFSSIWGGPLGETFRVEPYAGGELKATIHGQAEEIADVLRYALSRKYFKRPT